MGLLPITFIFTAFQIGLINKYKRMNNNLRLVINNVGNKDIDEKYFFEKKSKK